MNVCISSMASQSKHKWYNANAGKTYHVGSMSLYIKNIKGKKYIAFFLVPVCILLQFYKTEESTDRQARQVSIPIDTLGLDSTKNCNLSTDSMLSCDRGPQFNVEWWPVPELMIPRRIMTHVRIPQFSVKFRSMFIIPRLIVISCLNWTLNWDPRSSFKIELLPFLSYVDQELIRVIFNV